MESTQRSEVFLACLKGVRRRLLATTGQLGRPASPWLPSVEYLPFGYNPAVHFPEPPATASEHERFACDVAFVGGADADRIPIARVVRAGLKVRCTEVIGTATRTYDRIGMVSCTTVNSGWQSAATVNICLGRKANRDGHAMRSLELPAMGRCLVVEDTAEHRELFGDDGQCVVYYRDVPQLVALVQQLCRNPERAMQSGASVRKRICETGRHTYADRLAAIMAVCGSNASTTRVNPIPA